jgi:hypothetical protein
MAENPMSRGGERGVAGEGSGFQFNKHCGVEELPGGSTPPGRRISVVEIRPNFSIRPIEILNSTFDPKSL